MGDILPLRALEALDEGNEGIREAVDALAVLLSREDRKFFLYRAFCTTHRDDALVVIASTVEVLVDSHRRRLYLRWRTEEEHLVLICCEVREDEQAGDMSVHLKSVKIGDDQSSYFYPRVAGWAASWGVEARVVSRSTLQALLYTAWQSLAMDGMED